MEKIRIALRNRGVGTSPLFAAVEGGYMKDHRARPELKFYGGHRGACPPSWPVRRSSPTPSRPT